MSALKIQDETRRGVLMARVVFTHPETGKRTNRRWATRAEAEAFLSVANGFGIAAALQADDGKRVARPVGDGFSSTPFADYATTYLERRRSLSTGSQDNYGQRIKMIRALPLGLIPLRDITPDHVEAFVTHMEGWLSPATRRPLKASTRANRLVFVRSVLTHAHRRGDIPTDPGAYVEPVAVDDEDVLKPTILDPRDFAAIVAHVAPEHVPFYAFALASGCRYGEIVALRWEDLEPDPEDDGIVLVKIRKGKTKAARRTTTVPRDLVTTIPLADAENVFPCYDGAHVWREHVWRRRWAEAVQRAQMPKTVAPGFEPLMISPRIHDLRHTHAVLMLTMGNMNVTALAARLGHSTPAITAKYYAEFGARQIATLGRIAATATAGFLTSAAPAHAR